MAKVGVESGVVAVVLVDGTEVGVAVVLQNFVIAAPNFGDDYKRFDKNHNSQSSPAPPMHGSG